MGDPKFSRRSYDTPSHPWQEKRIKAEVVFVYQYGLKNKTEVWKAQTILRNLREQSRELQARLRGDEPQAKIESNALIAKCGRMGLLPIGRATLNDILTLKEENIFSRRLQTIVFEKGMANTINQARQMIVHGHIFMNGHRITIPGYIVNRKEESSIMYDPASPFNDEMHPMRVSKKKVTNHRTKATNIVKEATAVADEADAKGDDIDAEDIVREGDQ